MIFKYQQFAETTDEAYSHITPEERDQVKKYANDADQWLTDLSIKQSNLPKSSDPVLLGKDIENKYRELWNQCEPIVNKPKPQPPKEEKNETNNNNQQNTGDANANANANQNANVNAENNNQNNTENNNANANQNQEEQPQATTEETQANQNAQTAQNQKNANKTDAMDVE